MDPGPTHDPRRLSAERPSLAQRWTLRAGLFLLPLAYSPFTYDQFVLPKLLLARFLIAVLIVLLAARFVAGRTLVVKWTPLDIPLVLFLASAALSSVFAESQNVALFGTYARYDGLLTLLTFVALFWLAVQSLGDRADARALIRVMLASAYAVGAVAILQSIHDSVEHGVFVHAFGSLGNPNVLGAFLALMIPLTLGELLAAQSVAARIVWLNVLVVTVLALFLSFSRSAWLATFVATLVVIFGRRRRLGGLRVLAPATAVVLLALGAGYLFGGTGQLERDVVVRALTIFVDPAAAVRSRPGIWTDSLRLVASRPLIGYGPDNVGLVFARFQSGDWGLTAGYNGAPVREPIDKTHAELLQVAATQGVLGAAAYLLVLVAFAFVFWRARKIEIALPVAAGWIGYQLVLQLNFTALAAAFPFWTFAAAAIVSCDAVRTRVVAVDRLGMRLIFAPVIAAAGGLMLWGVAIPYLADARLREAVDADYAGRPAEAQTLARQARQLAGHESVYAVEVANTAFELDQWSAAREAYRAAAGLGTFNALVYRNLALADGHLGLRAEGLEAARKAVELDRFDPANQAVLAEFESGP